MTPYRRDMPEVGHPIDLTIDGSVPSSLRGWYFRNGPGRFEVGKDRVAHPFDGDGAICRIHFDGSQSASLLIKYVQTEAYASPISDSTHQVILTCDAPPVD